MFEELAYHMSLAKSAKDRSEMVTQVARSMGRCKVWVYARLREAGWQSGRQRRKDAGVTSQDKEAVAMLAGLMFEGVRKNGKKTLSLADARSILEKNGVEFNVCNSQLSQLLRNMHLDLASLSRPSPATSMRSLYPNHVHQVDPSLCLIYYAPDGKQRQKNLVDDEVYKNKQFLNGKEHLKCWRYVLTDHYSSSICVRYYQASGELMTNLYDFLLYAWGAKKTPMYQFHGVPELLVWDCGSANTSRAITRALESLKVKTLAHKPGNPRAKGQVEKANHLVEVWLESRLKIQPVNSIDELNDLAERFCAAVNSDTLEGKDLRLVRNGIKLGSRLNQWQHITTEQLRTLPDIEVCQKLLTLEPESRKIDRSLRFSYDFPKLGRKTYQLRGELGIYVGKEVLVQPLLMGCEGSLIVQWEHLNEKIRIEVVPMELDRSGFSLESSIWGETYTSHQDTLAGKNVKQLKQLVYQDEKVTKDSRPFGSHNNGEGLVAHGFINSDGWSGLDITPQPRQGKPIDVSSPDVVEIHELFISCVDAVNRIVTQTGISPQGLYARFKEEYPEGVPTKRVYAFIQEILQMQKSKIG